MEGCSSARIWSTLLVHLLIHTFATLNGTQNLKSYCYHKSCMGLILKGGVLRLDFGELLMACAPPVRHPAAYSCTSLTTDAPAAPAASCPFAGWCRCWHLAWGAGPPLHWMCRIRTVRHHVCTIPIIAESHQHPSTNPELYCMYEYNRPVLVGTMSIPSCESYRFSKLVIG